MNGQTITFIYRWKIPVGLHSEFLEEWKDLTKSNLSNFGLIKATLYRVAEEDFISITEWPDEESWGKWKESLANHPSRNKWRQYRTAGPELLEQVVNVQ